MSTNCFTDTYFFDSFCDGDKHNVHHTYPSYQKRDSRNSGKKRCEHSGYTTYSSNHITLTLDSEIGCCIGFES